MHPLLAHHRRLALYLVAWIPVAALLGYLLSASGALAPGRAAALAVPLAFLYAFACLPVWYTCRALPLQGERVVPAIGAQLAAAVAAGALWAFVAFASVASVGSVASFATFASFALFSLGVLLYLLTAAGYYLCLGTESARRVEFLAREAELRALKAQVNPHFLFNSLNSISALTVRDPLQARQMCVLLGDFLRSTLRLGERRSVPLSEELDLVRAYLAVEQVRFGARLQLEERIAPAALAVMVPPLLLQPLVENAVVHGVAHLLDRGWIHLDASCADRALTLGIANRFDPEAPRRTGTGLGLANVRGRLLARYGAEARMESASDRDRFAVTITVPLEGGE